MLSGKSKFTNCCDDNFEDVVFDQVGAKVFKTGKGINLVFTEYSPFSLIKRRYPVCVVVKQAMTAAVICVRIIYLQIISPQQNNSNNPVAITSKGLHAKPDESARPMPGLRFHGRDFPYSFFRDRGAIQGHCLPHEEQHRRGRSL